MESAELGSGVAARGLRGLKWLAGAIGVVSLVLGTPAGAQTANPEMVKANIALATEIAGKDMLAPLSLCKTAANPAGASDEEIHAGLKKLMANSYTAPVKVFDNLYFLGTTWVSAWALTTSEGIILFDTLDNDDEAHASIEVGMQKLGLNPVNIRYIVVTHAHGDHYGGANYLAGKYHAKVILSEIDWQELEKPVLQFDDPNWGRPPKRDMAVKDGDHLTLGDTTVQLYVTAGHTPGTLSVVFPVLDHGHAKTALLWGGTAFNFGAIAPRLQSYIASSDRFEAIAKEQNIQVLLSNHPGYDESFAKMERLRHRQPGDDHPYVIGSDAVARFLKVAGLCARATLASFDSEALQQIQR